MINLVHESFFTSVVAINEYLSNSDIDDMLKLDKVRRELAKAYSALFAGAPVANIVLELEKELYSIMSEMKSK